MCPANHVQVAPSRARGLKQSHAFAVPQRRRVAPSRARGLKQIYLLALGSVSCRALTGAWIETLQQNVILCRSKSRALTGAWIETVVGGITAGCASRRALTGAWIETVVTTLAMWLRDRRALTGAWIETAIARPGCRLPYVAPSRARGLKRFIPEVG